MLLQNTDDLFFAEPPLLHLRISFRRPSSKLRRSCKILKFNWSKLSRAGHIDARRSSLERCMSDGLLPVVCGSREDCPSDEGLSKNDGITAKVDRLSATSSENPRSLPAHLGGRPLCVNDFVISADEKTSIQAEPEITDFAARSEPPYLDLSGSLNIHRQGLRPRMKAASAAKSKRYLSQRLVTENQDAGALQVSSPRILDHGQLLRASRPESCQTLLRPTGLTRSSPHSDLRQLAQPSRGLFLDRSEKKRSGISLLWPNSSLPGPL
jgi:hypothetical protein